MIKPESLKIQAEKLGNPVVRWHNIAYAELDQKETSEITCLLGSLAAALREKTNYKNPEPTLFNRVGNATYAFNKGKNIPAQIFISEESSQGDIDWILFFHGHGIGVIAIGGIGYTQQTEFPSSRERIVSDLVLPKLRTASLALL